MCPRPNACQGESGEEMATIHSRLIVWVSGISLSRMKVPASLPATDHRPIPAAILPRADFPKRWQQAVHKGGGVRAVDPLTCHISATRVTQPSRPPFESRIQCGREKPAVRVSIALWSHSKPEPRTIPQSQIGPTRSGSVATNRIRSALARMKSVVFARSATHDRRFTVRCTSLDLRSLFTTGWPFSFGSPKDRRLRLSS